MTALKTAFPELFREFLQSYPLTPAGQQHVESYPLQRQLGQQNYQRILAAIATHQDITDLVLLTLLPYTRSPNNQQRGAWVHIAPSLAGDIKLKFEAAGWTKPEDWPQVAHAIWQLVSRCHDHPEQLAAACDQFSANPVTKGFQTGMITPILNALRPDDFLLINNKSRSVINEIAGTDYRQKLQDYPAINATGRSLIQSLQPEIEHLLSVYLPDHLQLRDETRPSQQS